MLGIIIFIFAFVMYSLIIWAWTAVIWYENGFKDGTKREKEEAKNVF